MKVTRKGPVVSTLEADWLELTTFYYKQGLALVDSFVHWEMSKGEYCSQDIMKLLLVYIELLSFEKKLWLYFASF